MASDPLSRAVRTVRVLHRAGVLRLDPRATVATAVAVRKWGKGLAGAAAGNAATNGDGVCLRDDEGPVTHAELHDRSSRLAATLADRGIGPGDGVALLCRDSRYFAYGAVATAKLGADLILLNTAFSAPQLRDVVARESTRALIHDAEFSDLIGDGDFVRLDGEEAVEAAIAGAPRAEPDPPPGPGRTILLTSGTTGTPKGARRPPEVPTDAVVAVLDRIPITRRDRHFVVAPMFHAWGFAHFGLGLLLGCEMVVRRRFDAEATLELIARHRVTSAAMVPVMAQRILALPDDVRARHDCSSLKIVALGGSAIPGDLAIRFMDAYGDVVYNSYGSSEVAIVSIATPADLRADFATAGKPVSSVVVRLLDGDGRPVPEGRPGRIFVGSEAAFEGYTGGGSKEAVDGLMATGDVGSFDGEGRLRIEGRDDDMIVSGGENVYPREVEDVISSLDGVAEAAVVGVDDAEFGQRLKAFVVAADGAGLTEDGVKAAVKGELARYKVPREVVFLDELPRTATGKVLKRELA